MLAERRAEQPLHRRGRARRLCVAGFLPRRAARPLGGAGVRHHARPCDPARLAAHRRPRAAAARGPYRPGAQLAVDRVRSPGGGAWHTLGTWTFPAGWNRVVLLRRAPAGAVVVADGVRVRESSTP